MKKTDELSVNIGTLQLHDNIVKLIAECILKIEEKNDNCNLCPSDS